MRELWGLALVAVVSAARADAIVAHPISALELPRALMGRGELVSALAFHDASGDNVAAFYRSLDGERDGARLEVALWTSSGAREGRVLRVVRDGVPACELDLFAEFVDAATSVTDLDGDGFGELTFAYRTGCTGDVSPVTQKLLVLEQREKYILRGTTRVDGGDGVPLGGAMRPDPALAHHARFLAHARAVWARVVED